MKPSEGKCQTMVIVNQECIEHKLKGFVAPACGGKANLILNLLTKNGSE